MIITIKEKDLIKRKNDHETTKKDYPFVAFTNSGMLIDELAYSAKQWTSDDLQDNNFDYEPNEPYNFDFEADLLSNTKTSKDLAKIIKTCLDQNIVTAVNSKLQAGAYMALNFPEKWQELLTAYTEAIKNQNSNDITISTEYRDELAEAVTSFNDHLYHEWLNGDRSTSGVLEEIRKYYGADSIDYNKKNSDEIIFSFDDEEVKEKIQGYSGFGSDQKVTAGNLKKLILLDIFEASEARKYKDDQENAKRRAERERLAIYKAEQATKAEADRKAKLLSMKLK